jgi:hypothetical protein
MLYSSMSVTLRREITRREVVGCGRKNGCGLPVRGFPNREAANLSSYRLLEPGRATYALRANEVESHSGPAFVAFSTMPV